MPCLTFSFSLLQNHFLIFKNLLENTSYKFSPFCFIWNLSLQVINLLLIVRFHSLYLLFARSILFDTLLIHFGWLSKRHLSKVKKTFRNFRRKIKVYSGNFTEFLRFIELIFIKPILSTVCVVVDWLIRVAHSICLYEEMLLRL